MSKRFRKKKSDVNWIIIGFRHFIKDKISVIGCSRIPKIVLWLECCDFLNDLCKTLTGLPWEFMPLVNVLVFLCWNTFLPDNGGIYESSGHVKEIQGGVFPKFFYLASVIPAEEVKIVDGHINLTFLGSHVIHLINNSDCWYSIVQDVLKFRFFLWVVVEHGSELVNLCNIFWTEAVLVELNWVVHVHTPLDSKEEMMSHVEVPLDFSSVN